MNEDEPLKLVSIKALGGIGDTNTIEYLFPLIEDSSVTVKSAAISALAVFDTLLIPYIEKRLEKEFSPELLLLGARTVEKDSSDYRERVKNILFEQIEDSDQEKRKYAARGLVLLGGEDVKEKFSAMFDSEENPIVKSIIRRYLDGLLQRH